MRLTPGPLHLLVAMHRGAALSEGTGPYGTWFVLTRPSRDPVRVHARGVNSLHKLAFIERADDFEWSVAAAGRAWLAANGITARLDKHS